MNRFQSIIEARGLPAIRAAFGVDVVYTPPYTPPAEPEPVSTWMTLQYGSDLVGQLSPRFERRLTARLPKSEVPSPKIGATLVAGAETYRIDQQTDETEFFITVAIREITSP